MHVLHKRPVSWIFSTILVFKCGRIRMSNLDFIFIRMYVYIIDNQFQVSNGLKGVVSS